MADFQLLPTWVHPLEPEYHNIITPVDSMKKEYMNLSATAVEKFRLVFEGMSDANFKTLRDHYKTSYGEYDNFDWKNAYIPDYILTLLGLTSEDISGRWVRGSFRSKPLANSWDADITFEKAV